MEWQRVAPDRPTPEHGTAELVLPAPRHRDSGGRNLPLARRLAPTARPYSSGPSCGSLPLGFISLLQKWGFS